MAIGFVLTVIGLAMMVTIVMLPAGVVLGLIGVQWSSPASFSPANENHRPREVTPEALSTSSGGLRLTKAL